LIKRKVSVLFLVFVLSLSMVFASLSYNNKAAAEPIGLTPTSAPIEETMQNVADRLDMVLDRGDKLDPMLRTFVVTGDLDRNVVITSTGDISVMLYADPSVKMTDLHAVSKVKWTMDLKLFKIVWASVSDAASLRTLEALDSVRYIEADAIIQYDPVQPIDNPQMFDIGDYVGATAAHVAGYDGTDVTIGIVDGAVDFSLPDMQDAIYYDGEGRPGSWDPSGVGIVNMVLANNTPLTGNITAYLEDGNVLTYVSGEKTYLNVTGWDPVTNDRGTDYNLIGRFIDVYEGAWGINNGSEFVETVMWKDWEIPAGATKNYTVGWVMQQRRDGYAKVFAPALINEKTDLIIDWNGTNAWTAMWMEAFWYESIDLNVTADRDYISDMMDWSFVDDQTDGYVFKATGSSAVLVADIDNYGTDDLGLGSLTWAVDANDDLFCGITDDALTWNCMYPEDDTGGGENHGTWTSSAAASRGVYGHDVFDNGTDYYLPGIANGSKIIASNFFSSGGRLCSQFWTSGFHLQADGNFTYNAEGAKHKAEIVSNSWGISVALAADFSIYTLAWDILSVPGWMAEDYPGTLFLFSSGNSGGDYGTAGAPNDAFSAIAVGAAMTSHYYDETYMPGQKHGQIISFSSNGPSMIGMIEPDIVAPGYRGVSPQPFHNVWLGTGDSYVWWQGTSLSCPIAAGVAALIVQALKAKGWTYNPNDIKNILLSTATDMGYDGMIQGHGLVNAEAAVLAIHSASTTEYIFSNTDSFDNWAVEMAPLFDSWWVDYGYYWMDVWTGNVTTPMALEELSHIYFGAVTPGSKTEVNFTIEDYAGMRYDSSQMDTFAPWYYTMDAQYEFTVETGVYNDTSSPSGAVTERALYFNITEELAGDETWMASPYAFISLAFDDEYTGDIWTRMFDWNDTDADGTMSFYNSTARTGDYIQHIVRDYNDCNVLWLKVADPTALTNVFMHSPTLMIDDDNADWDGGTTVTVTITTWKKVPDTNVLVNPYIPGATATNITLVVPADAQYGTHEGSIKVVDDTFTHEIPYSYHVEFTLDTTDSAPKTVVDTFGDELTPYESGALFTSFGPSAAGYRTFKFTVPDDCPTYNRSILVLRAEWENVGTVVDISMYSPTFENAWSPEAGSGGRLEDSLANTVIYDHGGLVNGTWWLVVQGSAINGVDVPENITVSLAWYDELPDAATYEFTYTTSDRAGVFPIVNEDVVWGDHAVVNMSFSAFNVVNLPEYEIDYVEIGFLSGLYEVVTGDLVIPSASYDPFSGAIQLDQFAWARVDGIVEGDTVAIEVDFSNGDCDIMVWWADTDNSTWTYANNLVGDAMATGAKPEIGSFVAGRSGAIMVGIFDYDLQAGTYEVTVDTLVGVTDSADANEVLYDTYDLLRNGTFTVEVYAYTDTGVVWDVTYLTLTFENFFAPEMKTVTVAGTGAQKTISWTSSDLNAGDEHFYEVLISADGGTTYQLIALNITTTSYVWDSTSFLTRDTYRAKVKVFDNDPTENPDAAATGEFWMGLTDSMESSVFSAGTLAPPTTTTPPPTTTTEEPVIPILDPLIIGLIAGIGAGVVVVLILFLVKKR